MEEPRRAVERDEGTEDVKYTGLYLFIYSPGASEKDTEAAMPTPTRRVEGTHNGGDTVAGPLPLYYARRRATLGERVAPPSRVLCQLCVSIKREREKERRAGGGRGGQRGGEVLSCNARCGTWDDKGHRCMKAEKAMSRSSQINATARIGDAPRSCRSSFFDTRYRMRGLNIVRHVDR